MTIKKFILGALLGIVGVPLLLIVAIVVSIRWHDRTNGSIVSSGVKRDYLLHVPPSYDRAKATPLVISLHPAAGWPALEMNTSRWNRFADSLGFIVVYPSGSLEGPRIWHVERDPGLARDVRFISELIDTLSQRYHLDPDRIYADGLSNGGGMAFVLSCQLSGRIAAIGMVAAARSLPYSWCTERRPMPVIAFHGTADPVVPYLGGGTWVGPDIFPDVPGFTAAWARRNGCGPVPIDTAVAADVTRRTYSGCARGADVVLYTVQGGGHTWPGGKPMPRWLVGSMSNSVDATALMWAFYRDHPRSTP